MEQHRQRRFGNWCGHYLGWGHTLHKEDPDTGEIVPPLEERQCPGCGYEPLSMIIRRYSPPTPEE